MHKVGSQVMFDLGDGPKTGIVVRDSGPFVYIETSDGQINEVHESKILGELGSQFTQSPASIARTKRAQDSLGNLASNPSSQTKPPSFESDVATPEPSESAPPPAASGPHTGQSTGGSFSLGQQMRQRAQKMMEAEKAKGPTSGLGEQMRERAQKKMDQQWESGGSGGNMGEQMRQRAQKMMDSSWGSGGGGGSLGEQMKGQATRKMQKEKREQEWQKSQYWPRAFRAIGSFGLPAFDQLANMYDRFQAFDESARSYHGEQQHQPMGSRGPANAFASPEKDELKSLVDTLKDLVKQLGKEEPKPGFNAKGAFTPGGPNMGKTVLSEAPHATGADEKSRGGAGGSIFGAILSRALGPVAAFMGK